MIYIESEFPPETPTTLRLKASACNYFWRRIDSAVGSPNYDFNKKKTSPFHSIPLCLLLSLPVFLSLPFLLTVSLSHTLSLPPLSLSSFVSLPCSLSISCSSVLGFHGGGGRLVLHSAEWSCQQKTL